MDPDPGLKTYGSQHWLQSSRHDKLTLQRAGRLGLQLGEDVERVEVHAGDGDVVAVHLGRSVADPGCLYPGSQIQNSNKREG